MDNAKLQNKENKHLESNKNIEEKCCKNLPLTQMTIPVKEPNKAMLSLIHKMRKLKIMKSSLEGLDALYLLSPQSPASFLIWIMDLFLL